MPSDPQSYLGIYIFNKGVSVEYNRTMNSAKNREKESKLRIEEKKLHSSLVYRFAQIMFSQQKSLEERWSK